MFLGRLKKTIFLISLLALVSCGRRTAPQPYTFAEFHGSAQNYQVHFRGGQLFIMADVSEASGVTGVKLVVESLGEDCSQCRRISQSIVFSLQDGVSLETGGSLTQRTLANQIEWQLRPNFSVLFPEDYFPPLEGKLFFKISLVGKDGDAGFSRSLAPIQPKALPDPVVKVQPLETGQFLATWEGATPVFGDDVFSATGFGLNFYSTNAEGVEKLNEYPVRVGYFTLPKGRIKAFTVDQFGNESKGIWILQESLAPAH